MSKEKVGAVIVAAGNSQRMKGVDKLFTQLNGKPLLARVMDTFQECKAIDEIVIVLGQTNMERGQRLANEHGWSKVTSICLGGSRRQDSVREGLKMLTDCHWVLIHDGARPLITTHLIEKGLDEARKHNTAIAAVPVKDTIKIASPDGFVHTTPLRDTLWAIQTPQVFRFDLISNAHDEITEDVTDDASMVEKLGHYVKLYMASYENIKITTPEDLAIAESILRNR